MAGIVAVRGLRFGDHDACDAVALRVAALPGQPGELIRHQRLQLIDAHRVYALAAAENGSQPLERGCCPRRGVAALLRLLHFGAALLQLAAECLEPSHRSVGERTAARCREEGAEPILTSAAGAMIRPPMLATTIDSTIAQTTTTAVYPMALSCGTFISAGSPRSAGTGRKVPRTRQESPARAESAARRQSTPACTSRPRL